MIDMQNQPDFRNIPIDKVGIKNLRYPIIVLDRKNGTQQTVAAINMYVDLPDIYKGTHMSRFIEVLNLYHGSISIENVGVEVFLEQKLPALPEGVVVIATVNAGMPRLAEIAAPCSSTRRENSS